MFLPISKPNGRRVKAILTKDVFVLDGVFTKGTEVNVISVETAGVKISDGKGNVGTFSYKINDVLEVLPDQN